MVIWGSYDDVLSYLAGTAAGGLERDDVALCEVVDLRWDGSECPPRILLAGDMEVLKRGGRMSFVFGFVEPDWSGDGRWRVYAYCPGLGRCDSFADSLVEAKAVLVQAVEGQFRNYYWPEALLRISLRDAVLSRGLARSTA